MADSTVQADPRAAESRGESTRGAPVHSPLTDIYESEPGLVMLVEMPGVRIEEASVTLEKGVLRIAAQAHGEAPTGYSASHAEYRAGDFERAFSLSDAIDADSIKATMRNGVLKIVLSRAGPAPAQKIAVGPG